MPIPFIVSDAGRAALVNAKHDGTNAVTIAQVGVSGTPIVATPGSNNLPGEVKRLATISGSAVAADTMHVIVRDESADVFTVRSVAFYLSDGTFFGAYGQPGVIAEKSAQAMLLLAIDVIFADIDAAMIQFGDANFLNPPATTDTAGVVKLATDAEAEALVNALKALTPRGLGRVFTAANILSRLLTVDGAGSGLDADLLDGQDGSYYTNITARLGYTPLNAASYTGAEILSRLLTVDGAGSTLDADLLDGRHGSEFALLNGSTPFTGTVVGLANEAFRAAGASPYLAFTNASASQRWGYIQHTGASGNMYLNNEANGGFIFSFGGADRVFLTAAALNVTVPLQQNGSQVWTAANDGAGSGMDSDLLDGQQGSFYTNIPARLGYTPANAGGQAFSGAISSTAVTAGTGSGYVRMVEGNINNSGYVEFVRHNGTREGYIGFAAAGGSIPLISETGAGFDFRVGGVNSLSVTSAGANVVGALQNNGNQVWHPANDGSGSGMDADMVDGRHASEFALLNSSPSFNGNVSATGFSTGGGSTANGGFFIDASAVFKKPAGTLIDLQVDEGDVQRFDRGSNRWDWIIASAGVAWLSSTTFGVPNISVGANISAGGIVSGSNVTVGGYGVWHPANDGSGSGMDADMVDGRHAWEFALLTDATRAGSNANGYWEKRPNGVIEQWGTLPGPYNEGQIAIAFPIQFTDVNSIVITANAVNSVASDKYDLSIQRVSRTVDGCIVYAQYSAAASSINQINGVDWRAVGR